MSQQLPDFMQTKYLTGIVRSGDVDTNYIGNRWFPFKDTPTDEFREWLQLDENPLAPHVAIDSETPIIPADMFNLVQGGIAYIRYKARFSESDLRVFTEIPVYGGPTSLGNQMRVEGERKIMSKVEMLSNSVDARLEYLALNALQGSIAYDSVSSNGNIQYTVAMGGTFHSSNRKTASPLWDGSSPLPVTDLIGWIGEVEDLTGVAPTTMICSPKTLRTLGQITGIRQLWGSLRSTGVTPAGLAATQVAGALSLIGIDEVIVYKARYTTRTEAGSGVVTRTRTRFLPENRILLVPSTPLGFMMTAPAAANNFSTGKFAWTKRQEDPWVVEVGAGIYAFPFMNNNQHKVLEATVLA